MQAEAVFMTVSTYFLIWKLEANTQMRMNNSTNAFSNYKKEGVKFVSLAGEDLE